MSEIVERAAKHIARIVPLGCGGGWNEPHGHDFPNQYSAAEQKLIRSIVIAAIEAIREPTEAMVSAGMLAGEGPEFADPDETWRTMIDAALTVRA